MYGSLLPLRWGEGGQNHPLPPAPLPLGDNPLPLAPRPTPMPTNTPIPSVFPCLRGEPVRDTNLPLKGQGEQG